MTSAPKVTVEVGEDFDVASKNLSRFVVVQANNAVKDLGFTWDARADAPDDYEKLQKAYKLSRQTGQPLPVSSLYCDSVIYQKVEINYAMRFWHDTLHVETGLTFSLDDELELGLHHLKVAENNGIVKDSLEWRILRVDILGQNYLLGIAKRFPLDQATFVHGCINHGLDAGVLLEARR
jgi:hypothetical protein